jgi:hypothetical protein
MQKAGAINFRLPGVGVRWDVYLYPAEQFAEHALGATGGKFRVQLKELAQDEKPNSKWPTWFSLSGAQYEFFTLAEVMGIFQERLNRAAGRQDAPEVDKRLCAKGVRCFYKLGESDRMTFTVCESFPIYGIEHTRIMELHEPVPVSALRIYEPVKPEASPKGDRAEIE